MAPTVRCESISFTEQTVGYGSNPIKAYAAGIPCGNQSAAPRRAARNASTQADIDGDADVDVLSANYNGYEAAWYDNDGRVSSVVLDRRGNTLTLRHSSERSEARSFSSSRPHDAGPAHSRSALSQLLAAP